jgi:hypothetical protein
MKNATRFLAGVMCIAVMAAGGMAGCDDDVTSSGEQETAITGPCRLVVNNQTGVAEKIYFDGAFIGTVATSNSRSWNAPEDLHTITAKNNVYNDYVTDITFVANQTATLRLYLNTLSKQTSTLVINTSPIYQSRDSDPAASIIKKIEIVTDP